MKIVFVILGGILLAQSCVTTSDARPNNNQPSSVRTTIPTRIIISSVAKEKRVVRRTARYGDTTSIRVSDLGDIPAQYSGAPPIFVPACRAKTASGHRQTF